MDFKGILFSGGKKPILNGSYYMIPFIKHSWNKPIEMENKSVVARGQGWVGDVNDYKGVEQGEFFLVMEQFCTLIVVVVTQMYT